MLFVCALLGSYKPPLSTNCNNFLIASEQLKLRYCWISLLLNGTPDCFSRSLSRLLNLNYVYGHCCCCCDIGPTRLLPDDMFKAPFRLLVSEIRSLP